jgi:hypothetical protein
MQDETKESCRICKEPMDTRQCFCLKCGESRCESCNKEETCEAVDIFLGREAIK